MVLMSVTCPLLLCLLSALVEVHSQTVPYVSFMGTSLPNHSYVDLPLVGNAGDGSDSVQCHTDLDTCCSGAQGDDRGDWHAPGSQGRLPFRDESGDIYEVRTAQRVDLRRRNNADTSSIYRCTIETKAVHSDDTGREIVYAGLYASGGDVTISDGMTFTVDSDLNGESPQFILTCTSTGGPATTVTWTRDSDAVSGGMTVLDDPVTTQYTHMLTVTGRLGGQYQCTVSNSKPSTATAQLTVAAASAPTDFMAVQEGLTGIRVSWTPPTPLGDTTGYRIYYSGGSSGSVDVSGGSTDNYLLTGLQNGASYTISIVGTSDLIPSHHFDYSITLNPIPGQPSLTVGSTTATTISLSWSVPSGSVVDSYEVVWEGDTTGNRTTISYGSTRYTVTGLKENSSYTITVTATNAAGSAVSYPVTLITEEAMSSGAPSTDNCNTAGVVGGVIVAVAFIVAMTTLLVVALLRLRCGLPARTPVQEPMKSTDVPTSTNEAYELTVQAEKKGKGEAGARARGRGGEEGYMYEEVSAHPPAQPVAAGEVPSLPPFHSQVPAAGEPVYELDIP